MTPADAADLLANLVGRALTGEALQLPEASTAQALARSLEDSGWDAARLMELRQARHAAAEPWPFVLTAADRGPVGPAQLHAAVSAVLAELGISPRSRVRDRDAPLSARDQALLAERPPHHGNVG